MSGGKITWPFMLLHTYCAYSIAYKADPESFAYTDFIFTCPNSLTRNRSLWNVISVEQDPHVNISKFQTCGKTLESVSLPVLVVEETVK